MHYHPTLSLGTVVGARQVPLYFSRQVLPPQFGGTGPSLWTTSLLGVVLGGDLPGGDQTAVVVFAGEVFVSLVWKGGVWGEERCELCTRKVQKQARSIQHCGQVGAGATWRLEVVY